MNGRMNGVLLAELRAQVVEAGLEALRRGIVHGTAGNFSIRDRESGLIAISPSGIPYPKTTPADVVVVDNDANIVDGHRKPSSETPMHTMIMKARPDIRAIRPYALPLFDGSGHYLRILAADPDRGLLRGRGACPRYALRAHRLAGHR